MVGATRHLLTSVGMNDDVADAEVIEGRPGDDIVEPVRALGDEIEEADVVTAAPTSATSAELLTFPRMHAERSGSHSANRAPWR